MKKLEIFKTIQLILYVVMTIACFSLITFSQTAYGAVSSNPHTRMVTILLWIVMAASFFFIFIDFSLYAKQQKTLDTLHSNVHSDPMANIANRLSCDEVIEKYLDQPIPDDFGCVMFDLSNIVEINKNYGRKQGNQAIKKFSVILKMASVNHCFVGRNGGNQFLALFESGSDEKIHAFINRVAEKVDENNAAEGAIPIKYNYGIAFHDQAGDGDITAMIALSSKRAKGLA